jgi:DNA-directed RNA polymerase subunit RPC12/RpoP
VPGDGQQAATAGAHLPQAGARQGEHDRPRGPAGVAALERRIDGAADRLDGRVRSKASKHHLAACPECDLRWDVCVVDVVGFDEIGADVLKCLRCGEIVHQPPATDRDVVR